MNREDRWHNARAARDYATTSDEGSSDGNSSDFEEGNGYNANESMNQEQMGNLYAALLEAIQVGNANNAVLTNMARTQQAFFEQEAERAAAFRQQQRRVKLDASSFPPFEDSGTEEKKMASFIAWEKGVRNTLDAVEAVDRMPFASIAAAILASFRGSALEKATTLNAGDYADTDALFDSLRTLFCGAAMREKSYNLFNAAVQELDEDINTFWSRLQALWLQAYAEADRSVAQLIRRFIEGLRNGKLQDRLVCREEGLPNDYAEVRDLAIRISGQLDTVAMLKKDRKAGNWRPTGGAAGGGRGTPMDIGAANRGNGKKNGGGVHNVNAGGNQGKTNENTAGRTRVDKDQCLRCKGYGHWKNECPNRRNGARGGGGSVNNVDSGPAEADKEEDSDDDSDDWVGCAAMSSRSSVSSGSSGNSQGQA